MPGIAMISEMGRKPVSAKHFDKDLSLSEVFAQKLSKARPTKKPIESSSIDRRMIKIDDLKIDPSYRSDPNPKKVANLATYWCDTLFQPIMVAEKNGKFFVMDGLKRVLAQMLRGKKTIEANIITAGSDFDRFYICLDDADAQKPPRSSAKHRQALQDTTHPFHTEAIELQRICADLEIKIAEHQAAGVLSGTDRLMHAIQWYGSDTVEHAFRIYRQTWPKERIHAYLMSGIAAWLHVYRDKRFITDEKASDAIKAIYPRHRDMLTEGKTKNPQRLSSDILYAEMITDAYNKTTYGHGRGRLNRYKVREKFNQDVVMC